MKMLDRQEKNNTAGEADKRRAFGFVA